MTLRPLHGPLMQQLVEEEVKLLRISMLPLDEVKCESAHPNMGNECSVEVVALATCKCLGDSGRCCQNTVEWIAEQARKGFDCSLCHTPIAECWSTRPI